MARRAAKGRTPTSPTECRRAANRGQQHDAMTEAGDSTFSSCSATGLSRGTPAHARMLHSAVAAAPAYGAWSLGAMAKLRRRNVCSSRAARGFTLIEVTIAMAIVALLFAAVVISVGAILGTKAKSTAAELAGVVRSLYDTAGLSGKTCRLVFQLPGPRQDEKTRYWAECAAGNVTTRRDRDEFLREEQRRDREREKQAARQPPPTDHEPTLQ